MMGLKNFNKPRPRWARATSKLLRALGVIAVGISWKFNSLDGATISALLTASSDYILDLFPPDEPQGEDTSETQVNP